MPVKKKAIINSSNESVNPISKLAIIPGKTKGNIILKNVPIWFSPRSIEASSKLISRLLKAEFIISIEKGIISKVCPSTTLQRFKDNPSWINTVSRETPTIISGNTSGASIKVKDICFPVKLYLVDAREAKTPSVVAKILEEIATIIEFLNASCNVSWYNNLSNQ